MLKYDEEMFDIKKELTFNMVYCKLKYKSLWNLFHHLFASKLRRR